MGARVQRIFGLLFLVLFIFLFSGCIPPELRLRYEPVSPEPVRIGAVVPLSGPEKDAGTRLLEGIRFAVEEKNRSHGHRGRQIDLIVLDSTGTPEGAARAAASCAAAGAVALIAGGGQPDLSAVIAQGEALRLPVVVPMVSGDDELLPSSRFAFRTDLAGRQEAEVIAGYLLYWRRVYRLGVISQEAPASRRAARDVTQAFKDIGGGVVRSADIGSGDVEKELREFVTYGPTAVFLALDAPKSAEILKKLRSIGFGGIICGGRSWDNEAFFGALSGYSGFGDCFYTTAYSSENQSEEFVRFRKDFRARRFHFPVEGEIEGYDALNWLLIGLGSNATDIYKFNRNWLTIKKLPGAAGLYSMEYSGEVDRTVYVNSIGVRLFESPLPFGRQSRAVQYSQLELFREIAEEGK